MAKYIVGAAECFLNVDQIVSLNIWGTGLRPNAHPRKDDDSEYSYLIAEMSNGALHELGLWAHIEDARLARLALIEEFESSTKTVIEVRSERHKFPRRLMHRASNNSVIEAELSSIREMAENHTEGGK